MKVFFPLFLTTLFLLLISSSLKSQVTADFSANTTWGCGSVTVTFSDQSTGPISSWSWDFGNGSPLSSIQNPTISYTSPGTYTVSLTVSDGTNSDTHTITDYIVVYNNPTASFDATPLSGCNPLTVNFTDLSTLGDAPISSWNWFFGDGNSSNQQNPIYTYTSQGGPYNIYLNITDDNSCQSTINVSNMIFVSDTPHIMIDALASSYCSAPFTVDFINNTTGYGSIVSWEWNFGDGSPTDNSFEPSHTYTAIGDYDVTLTATDEYGCSNTHIFTGFVSLNQITASFNITQGDTLCLNEPAQFNNTSGINCQWNFGDGSLSNLDNPMHAYSANGTYTVTLIAAPGDACADTISMDIYVEEAVANFTSTPAIGCYTPLPVDFLADANSNIASYEWHFGDGDIFTSSSNTATNSYDSPGGFSDTLFVTTYNGCTDMFVIPNNVVVQYPTADFTPSEINGCAPLIVDFTDNSFAIESVDTYAWTFPGGTPTTSNLQNPTGIIFNTAGEYTVELTITTAPSGCTDTYTFEIEVGSNQNPNFSISRDTLCADDTLSFFNLSTDTNLIDTYNWGFSQEFSPQEYYVYSDGVCSDTGFCDVTLITEYNGCYDTLKVDSAIYVNGPIIRSIAASMDCDSSMVWSFIGDIVDGEYWEWDFGDGTILSNSTNNTITHTYATTGHYWVYCTAENNATGCDYKDSVDFNVYDLIAVLNGPDTVCVGVQYSYSGSASQDASQYHYSFGNGQVTNWIGAASANVTYGSAGAYTIEFIARDPNGCTDTLYKDIFAVQPVASFSADTLVGCASFEVQFSDSSSSETPIVSWYWQFGDGSTSDTINPLHIYQNTGNYTVSLIATDSAGCTNSVVFNNYIQVFDVTANFGISDTITCINTEIEAIPDSNSVYNYYWSFYGGNGDSTATSPEILYPDTGVYDMQLIVEHNTYGCRDTMHIDSIIEIQNIEVDLSLTQDTFECYLATITNSILLNNTDDIFNPTWSWTFGDGGTSNVQHPAYQYSMPGDYYISLTANLNTSGCTDSDSVQIHLDGPYASLGTIDEVACLGEDVTFSLTNTINVDSNYCQWVFQDGGTSNGLIVIHPYTVIDTFIYTVDISTPNCAVDLLEDTIQIINVTSRFDIDDIGGCTPHVINLTNNSIPSPLSPLQFNWDFDDGTSSGDMYPPPHSYINTGSTDDNYTITLTVTDSVYGCIDDTSINIIVYAAPQITVSNDAFICHGEEVHLSVSSNNANISVVSWEPTDWLDNPGSVNTIAKPESDTTYHVIIYDNHLCTNEDSVRISVQQEPIATISPDTMIIIGESAYLFINTDQNNVTYTWSPGATMSCTDCSDPTVNPLETTEYKILYEDSAKCFELESFVLVEVKEEYTLDVPTAFTPNGDGNNDFIYVKGWGVKELIEFKIFNRWGQQIFLSDDLHQGWDGTFNGKPQNMDTYAYYVKVKLWSGSEMEKKGTINLLR